MVTAVERGLSTSADTVLLQTANADDRLLVTRDRDYGNLVFVQGMNGGVLYLRMLPATIPAVHAELERVLQSYSELELKGLFVVIEPGGHRTRKTSRFSP